MLRARGWAPPKPAECLARQGVLREGAMQAGNEISHPPCQFPAPFPPPAYFYPLPLRSHSISSHPVPSDHDISPPLPSWERWGWRWGPGPRRDPA